MNRKMIIAASVGATVLAVCGAGGAYYFMNGATNTQAAEEGAAATAENSQINVQPAAVDYTEKKESIKQLVRKLGIAQDKVVYGVKDALDEQDHVIIEIAESLDEIDLDAWIKPPDFRSILVYVLSGGEPDVLQRIVEAKAGSAHDQKLAEGILRFSENQPEKSREALDTIEPRLLDAQLMGPLSLAKASLFAKTEPIKAITLLDDARLINPHTAIEEAAIRRQIPLLMSGGKKVQAVKLGVDYVHRFGRSAYSETFFDELARYFIDGIDAGGDELITEFLADIETAPRDPRVEVMLAIARQALTKGRLPVARLMAESAQKIAETPSSAHTRATVYLAAAEAPTESAATAIDRLKSVESESLSEEDANIRQVATEVASAVNDAQLYTSPAAPESASNNSGNANGTLLKAQTAIKEADAMISGSGK